MGRAAQAAGELPGIIAGASSAAAVAWQARLQRSPPPCAGAPPAPPAHPRTCHNGEAAAHAHHGPHPDRDAAALAGGRGRGGRRGGRRRRRGGQDRVDGLQTRVKSGGREAGLPRRRVGTQQSERARPGRQAGQRRTGAAAALAVVRMEALIPAGMPAATSCCCMIWEVAALATLLNLQGRGQWWVGGWVRWGVLEERCGRGARKRGPCRAGSPCTQPDAAPTRPRSAHRRPPPLPHFCASRSAWVKVTLTMEVAEASGAAGPVARKAPSTATPCVDRYACSDRVIASLSFSLPCAGGVVGGRRPHTAVCNQRQPAAQRRGHAGRTSSQPPQRPPACLSSRQAWASPTHSRPLCPSGSTPSRHHPCRPPPHPPPGCRWPPPPAPAWWQSPPAGAACAAPRCSTRWSRWRRWR